MIATPPRIDRHTTIYPAILNELLSPDIGTDTDAPIPVGIVKSDKPVLESVREPCAAVNAECTSTVVTCPVAHGMADDKGSLPPTTATPRSDVADESGLSAHCVFHVS
jgi:hypothetical protein